MKKNFFIIISICSIFLTGCWDKDELEDWGYIAAIGIDKDLSDRFDITFQLTNPQVGTSTKTNVPEPPQEVVTFPVKNLSTSRDLASTFVTRRLTMSHAVAMVVSEEMASSDKFYHLLEATLRDRDIRGDINLIICPEKASLFINSNKPKMETRPTKYYSFMTQRWKDTGLVPISSLYRFIKRTEYEQGLFLAIYATSRKGTEKKDSEQETEILAGETGRENGDPIEMVGSAVFKNGKMIGKINGFESQLALLLRRQRSIKSISINVKDPLDSNYTIGAKLTPAGNTKIKMDLKASVPTIDVTVPIETSITGIPSFINYATDKDKQTVLEKCLEEYLEGKTNTLIKKTQNEFKGEPFIWSSEARKHFLTNKAFDDYDWMKKYSSAEVNVNFKVKLVDFGKGLKTPYDKNTEDNQ